MPEIRLSIIIPFYNVEKYIAQCLDSIYAQDISESEYEVICVNDCSPDNSRDIVLKYQKKHSNLILMEHEKNKMLGAARNTGFRAARGKYVWFIDSDDYIKENVLGRLLDIAEKNELDILHFNMQIDAYKEINWNPYFPYNTEVISGISYLNIEFPYAQRLASAWSKIFLSDFLVMHNLPYPEGVYWEDNTHTLTSTILASRFMYIADKIYVYRINDNSITQKNRNSSRKLTDKIIYCLDCIALLEKYNEESFAKEAKDFYLSVISVFSPQMILYMPLKEKLSFLKETKKFNKKILFNYFPFKKRFIYTCPFVIFPFSLLRPFRLLKHRLIK